MTESDIQKKAMLVALEKSLGIVSTACKEIDISRQTHYRWQTEDEEYKRAVDDISEAAIDVAESELHKLIKKGDTTAIIFYLKTKGKKRGYIERQEVDVRTPDGLTINYKNQPGNEPLPDANS